MGKSKRTKGSKAAIEAVLAAHQPVPDPKRKKRKPKKGKKDGLRGVEPVATVVDEVIDADPVVDAGAVRYIAVVPRPERVLAALKWAESGGLSLKVGEATVTIPTPDGWVPGWVLGHPALAGVSGDRLLRSLIADRKVEKRLNITLPTKATAVEYRLRAS